MQVLEALDWVSIIGFFAIALVVGAVVSRRAGSSSSEFFLSGRSMPWWLLGLSMVATTFAADTPNLVTQIVRENGVAGNWAWWAFLLNGMLTVFVYARLWRRSGVMTDIEFYELRYGGKPAAFLRGFRAIYLGVAVNALIMAVVSLAAIKIAGVMLGLTPLQTVLGAGAITLIYSMMGGLRGVLITDAIQFSVAIFGAVMAAKYAVSHVDVGGMAALLQHPNVLDKLSMLPDFSNPDVLVPVFIIPLAVQWWSVWYPGAEPGGGGYVAQRMLAAKSEKDAMGATLFFNAAHYALRPWPWIIVALASLIVFPDLESLARAFPHMPAEYIQNDLAYPAMLTFLPTGLLGIVVASLAAAYMSTMSTHLNWGASYVVLDWYRRFIRPEASEKNLVRTGRLTTLLLMVLASILALALESALAGFQVLLQVGAGTGLIYILRWFWWRINAWSEISAMIVSFIVALVLERVPGLEAWHKLCLGVGITTLTWITVTLLTAPADAATLRSFYRRIRPGGIGWRVVLAQAEADGDAITDVARRGELPVGIACMVFGCLAVYGALFATGCWIYGNLGWALALTAVAVASIGVLTRLWGPLTES